MRSSTIKNCVKLQHLQFHESYYLPGFFTFLSCQCLDWFQIEVVIQMQVIQIFSMNQQIQHVITLSTYLKAHFYPIQSRRLEEFGGFKRSEQISFLLRLWRSVMQSIQNIIFQQFLIAHPDFNGLTRRTMFSIPCFDQWNIQCLKNLKYEIIFT